MINNYLFMMEEKGLRFKTVYDVGACNGLWSTTLKEDYLYESEFIMFEANSEYNEVLKSTGIRYFNTVLSSPGRGEVEFFNGTNTGDSYYKETTTIYDQMDSIKLPTTTLDDLIEKYNLQIPQLLKLDTQGSELDILSGATKLVGKTELILTELPIIEYNKGAPNISDYLNYFKAHDYIPIDVIEVHRGEHTLIQLDILFILREAKNKYLSPNVQVRV